MTFLSQSDMLAQLDLIINYQLKIDTFSSCLRLYFLDLKKHCLHEILTRVNIYPR